VGSLMANYRVEDPWHRAQDICKPESMRLRRNLSAVINFAKFREEKLVPYTEMQEQTISLLEETQQLEDSNKELVRQEKLGHASHESHACGQRNLCTPQLDHTAASSQYPSHNSSSNNIATLGRTE
jgi:hypothetical protein